MAARIIQFGVDDLSRLQVLRNAGYTVDRCNTIMGFREIVWSVGKADAVAFTDADGRAGEETLAMIRSASPAPLILFEGNHRARDESEFNLVVRPLTPPETWLKDVWALIERSRASIGQTEPSPRAASSYLRQRAMSDREPSKQQAVLSFDEPFRGGLLSANPPPKLGVDSENWLGLIHGEFMKSMSAETLKEFESLASITSCDQGTLLFVEGQEPQEVYILLRGEVKQSIGTASGKRLTVHIGGPGEILGLGSAFTGEEHRTTAEVLHPCKVASLSCLKFLDFLLTHPKSSQAAAHQLGQSCEQAFTRLRTIGATSSNRARLARLLFEWLEAGKTTERGTQIHVALRHGEIAECVGTCRESITRILQDFQRRKIIAIHGALWTILDREALEQCAGIV
jgi:CRP/FNR family cyclic AMP-dependent transcriptional regulator